MKKIYRTDVLFIEFQIIMSDLFFKSGNAYFSIYHPNTYLDISGQPLSNSHIDINPMDGHEGDILPEVCR